MNTSKPLMHYVTEQVRLAARVQGVTSQSALARLSGLSQTTIRRYFWSDEREPSLDALITIAEALGTTASELLRLAEEARAAHERIEQGTATPHDRINAMNISATEKDRLHELLEEMRNDDDGAHGETRIG